MPKDTNITAFGETKTADEWASDPRCCHGSYKALSDRVLVLGWDPETAITHPLRGYNQKIKAFGQALNIYEWARSAVCIVSLQTLKRRLREGWDPEEALTHPVPKGKQPPTNLEVLGQQEEALASVREYWKDWKPLLKPPPPEKSLAELVRDVAEDTE